MIRVKVKCIKLNSNNYHSHLKKTDIDKVFDAFIFPCPQCGKNHYDIGKRFQYDNVHSFCQNKKCNSLLPKNIIFYDDELMKVISYPSPFEEFYDTEN